METGSMITMANNRTAADRRAIAEFLTGKSLSAPLVTTPAQAAMCKAKEAFNPNAGARWIGWGQNTNNTRFQDGTGAGIARNASRFGARPSPASWHCAQLRLNRSAPSGV
jgi:polyvinyl alcohol dehydrogenase (cytochrome)